MPEQAYNGWKSIWKGLQPALVVAGVSVAAAFAQLATPEALQSLGLPSAVAVFAVTALKNWAKNRNLGKE